MKRNSLNITLASVLAGGGLMIPQVALSHCDTMDGPVVQAAKVALERKEVTPVLRWVTKDGEAEVKAAFAKSLAVRTKGVEARELADQYFFETLLRVHRAGEGEPFTGLKPAGTDPGPVVTEADKALETGSADKVIKLVADEAAAGIRQRFAEVREKKRHADESVDAGREFVAAYVEYVHYAEGLHETAQGSGAPHKDASATAEQSEHKHNHKAPKT